MAFVDPQHYSAQTGVDPTHGACADHYLSEGARLGHDPNPFFDTHWYAVRHDLTQPGAANPLVHFVEHGVNDRLATSAVFDTRYYVAHNIEATQCGANPLQHFLNTGYRIGLRSAAHRPAADFGEWARNTIVESNMFDADWYGRTQRRLRVGDPLSHYLKHGLDNPPNPTFDLEHYLAMAPELRQVDVNPLLHFVVFGWRRDLSPNPDYTVAQYLAAHDGLVDAEQPVFVDPPASAAQRTRRNRDYLRWHGVYAQPRPSELDAMTARGLEIADPPVISVVMPVYNPRPPFLRQAIESVRAQTWPHWEFCIADDASTNPAIRDILEAAAGSDDRIKVVFREQNGHICAASNSALDVATGDWVALLDHDDLMARDALHHMAMAIGEHPDAALLYSDEDIINSNGRPSRPHFKSAWNEELFLRQNYMNHLSVYRRELVDDVGRFREGFEGSQDHDLALRVIAQAGGDRVVHVPRVLYSWRQFGDSETFSQEHLRRAEEARRQAVRDYLETVGRPGEVSTGPGGFNEVRYNVAGDPSVAVVIPTRDQAEVTERAVRSILDQTTWSNYRVVLVNNQSEEPETLELFERLRAEGVEVLDYPHPFNYSAINNFAVAATDSDLVALVNNDVEVIEPDWLSLMVSYAVRPEIGAVGAKLLYPNGRNQHAGVALGLFADNPGVAGHLFSRRLREDAGYYWRARLTQQLSAVTAACLVVERSKFDQVGGLDDANLAVAWNDINFCLDLRKAGFENVFCAEALLFHHESLSRGSDKEGAALERFLGETEYMRTKWGDALSADPFFNPNLGLDVKRTAAFESFAWPPRDRAPRRLDGQLR